MIEFRSVTKRFPGSGGPDVTAVDDLDLTVESGSLTVFVGPSGCGKTTSLRMINRMVTPTAGQILVDGRDVMSGDAAELRRGIGYVIQQAGLFPHRTVLDNVATVPLLLGRSKREARSRAAELMELVGLDAGMAKRYPVQLSGGQQQRVGVARALAADPPVLLMDEPFSAVDPVVRVNLQDELLRLQSELGKTIVFVTHDIDEAVKLGDRVAVFRVGGRLAQCAEPGELLSHPADEFVDGFVGRDRGYRGLGFRPADQLRLGELPTVAPDVLPDVPPGWHLVLDDDGRPRTWYRGAPLTRPAVSASSAGCHPPDGVAASEFPVGSLYPVGAGTLRVALDAALSSPSGLGVAVDGEGRAVGSVSAEDVMRELAATRDAH